MPKKQGMGLYDCMGRLLFMVIGKMVECVECGKRLGFFEGYYHPTLGKKSLVCGPCFVKVEESVARWRDFVLSNSFNPESSEPTLSIDWSSLFNRITGIKKQFTEAEEKKNPQAIRSESHSEVAFNHLNYNSNNALVQFGRRTV